MLEIWISKLRKHCNLSERAAAKHIKRVISHINSQSPLTAIPYDSGDLFCNIWWNAWTPAVLIGSYLSAECSYYAHRSRGHVMSLADMRNPFLVNTNLRYEVNAWCEEIKSHKAESSQKWSNICNQINMKGIQSIPAVNNSYMMIDFDWTEVFSAPDFLDSDTDKVPITPNQVWQHKKHQDVKAQIIKVFDDDSVEVIIVGVEPNGSHHFPMGRRFVTSSSKNFAEHWKLYKDVKAGANCTKCKKHFPYANNSSSFVCYSCKNGLT